MLIQCTKKLLDELKVSPNEITEEDALFSWHANIITVNRRKAVVLVNDSSRYTIVIYGITATEKKNIAEVIKDSIDAMLMADNIKTEIIKEYLKAKPKYIFTKTKNRASISQLNEACSIVKDYYEIIQPDSLHQPELSKAVNIYTCKLDGKLMEPNETFYQELEEYFNQKIFQCRAIKLKVTLKTESHNIWRKLIVPYDITFAQLNNVIQKSFNWQSYHLYDFIIFSKKNLIAHIISEYEAAEHMNEGDIISEDCCISEYLPKYKQIVHRYDYGDNWAHIIDIEDFQFDYEKNYPVCLAGEGNAPPEDVGGEPGYNEFIRIMLDPEDEEHHELKHWAIRQGFREFDINDVNRRLKRALIKSFRYR